MKTPTLLTRWIWEVLTGYTWAPATHLVLHMLASKVWDIYQSFPAFDIPMHFFGGSIIAYFWHGVYVSAIRLKIFGKPSAILHPMFVIGWASTSTIIWEDFEFLLDRYVGTNMQGGQFDTMKDMFLGMMGAMLFLSCYHIWEYWRSKRS